MGKVMQKEMIQQEIPVKELIMSAIEARQKAYAPYSRYAVGAAVLTGELRIYKGCNIENAAFTPGICAERVAVSKAVSEGARKLKAVAVAGSPMGGTADQTISQYAFPCGVCRQVLREFADPEEFLVIVARSPEDYKVFRLSQLLPESFGPENLR